MKPKINNSWYSSNLQEWETPKALFAYLDKIFNFTIDLAASEQNALCPQYYTEEMDALNKPWLGRCFVNPPFRLAGQFFKKASEEIIKDYCEVIVSLTPCRTDTAYFHKYVFPVAAEIWLIEGRVNYVNPFKDYKDRPPFPSMICIFRKKKAGYTVFKSINIKELV